MFVYFLSRKIKTQNYYEGFIFSAADILETTLVFYTGSFLMIFVGIVVSLGSGWRKSVTKHTELLVVTAVVIFAFMFLLFMPTTWDVLGFWRWCEFVDVGITMKVVIVIVCVVVLGLMIVGEKRCIAWGARGSHNK